jgi:hypothetical protein
MNTPTNKDRPYENWSKSFRKQILKYPGAKQAFKRLKRLGISDEILWGELIRYRVMNDLGAKFDAQKRKLRQHGRRRYTRLPNELRDVATQIEWLNQNFPPNIKRPDASKRLIAVVREEDRFGDLIERFKALPLTLRLYATLIEGTLRRKRSRSDIESKREKYPINFIRSHHHKGSRYFWPDFATLLTAANFAADIEDIVDPETLRRQFYPRKASPRS